MKKENEVVNKTNEDEYKKSLKEKEDSKTPKAKTNQGDVREKGVTDGQGNYIAMQNDVLTESQKQQTANGEWFSYEKFSDGSYNVGGAVKSASKLEESDSKKK